MTFLTFASHNQNSSSSMKYLRLQNILSLSITSLAITSVIEQRQVCRIATYFCLVFNNGTHPRLSWFNPFNFLRPFRFLLELGQLQSHQSKDVYICIPVYRQCSSTRNIYSRSPQIRDCEGYLLVPKQLQLVVDARLQERSEYLIYYSYILDLVDRISCLIASGSIQQCQFVHQFSFWVMFVQKMNSYNCRCFENSLTIMLILPYCLTQQKFMQVILAQISFIHQKLYKTKLEGAPRSTRASLSSLAIELTLTISCLNDHG